MLTTAVTDVCLVDKIRPYNAVRQRNPASASSFSAQSLQSKTLWFVWNACRNLDQMHAESRIIPFITLAKGHVLALAHR